jgi:hypothetical protein
LCLSGGEKCLATIISVQSVMNSLNCFIVYMMNLFQSVLNVVLRILYRELLVVILVYPLRDLVSILPIVKNLSLRLHQIQTNIFFEVSTNLSLH